MNTPKPHVLVVEDDSAIRTVIAALLSANYDVTAVGTGGEGLAAAAKSTPDLVLLDVGLPDMDGFEVCRRMKEQNERSSAIPVIFLTGHASAADEVEGFKAGGIDYVAKPVKPEVLLARVKNHVELKRKSDALEKLARLDGLTGLPNRRTFDAAANREWRRLARTCEPLAVILLDVDHFKQYNDTYGHGAGDDCLRKVANAAEAALQRPADMIARYGGEEFVALLPTTKLDGAMAVAEAIREAVASLGIAHSKSSAGDHVTVSLGVASMVPLAEQSITLLLEAADTQLYAAKGGGRNQAKGTELGLSL